MTSDMYKMIKEIREVNKKNGWDLFNEIIDWEDVHKLPAKLALAHSELSEGLEAFRGRKIFVKTGQTIQPEYPDGKVYDLGYMRDMTEEEKLANFKEEMADVVIRILDIMGGFPDTDFPLEIWDKINICRERGYKHGGKKL